MSKTIRNERTHGFIAKLQKARKMRKETRDMRTDDVFLADLLFDPYIPAQEA